MDLHLIRTLIKPVISFFFFFKLLKTAFGTKIYFFFSNALKNLNASYFPFTEKLSFLSKTLGAFPIGWFKIFWTSFWICLFLIKALKTLLFVPETSLELLWKKTFRLVTSGEKKTLFFFKISSLRVRYK